jgi:nifR3 family TIM-barrel protein
MTSTLAASGAGAPAPPAPLQIGPVVADGNLVLAPMAGVTASAFRRICREYGAGLVVTEMVSSDGLVRGGARTAEYMAFDPAERPIGIQLFGSDPEVMADAARRVETEARPDFIDMNFGCPVKKVVGRSAGSALLRQPRRLGAIARRVAAAVRLPVTAKIRSGWEVGSENAVEIARILEDSGVQAVAVHPRSRGEAFGGAAHWDIIRDVKAAVGIPVIGNGDVRAPADALNLLRLTGCDAVMIGRAALGSPWIFARIRHFLTTGEDLPPPTAAERIAMFLRHYRMLAEARAAAAAMRDLRSHFAWYTKGIPGSARLRGLVMSIDTPAAFEQAVEGFLADLRARGQADLPTEVEPPTDPALHFRPAGRDGMPAPAARPAWAAAPV